MYSALIPATYVCVKKLYLTFTSMCPVCSCLGCCYPNEMTVSEICNEDLCVITVDRGTIDDHLPNNVLNALKRCKQQFMDSVYNPGEVDHLRRKKSRDRHKEEEAKKRTDQKTGFVFPDLRNSLTASLKPEEIGIPQISVTMEGEAGEGRGGGVTVGRGGGVTAGRGGVTEEQVAALVGRNGTRLEAGEPLATIPEERSRSPSPTSLPTCSVVVQAEVCPDVDAGNRTNCQDLGAEGEGGGGKGGKHKKRPHLKLKLERHVAVDREEMVEGEGDGRDRGTEEEELHGSKIRLHVAEQVHSETTL